MFNLFINSRYLTLVNNCQTLKKMFLYTVFYVFLTREFQRPLFQMEPLKFFNTTRLGGRERNRGSVVLYQSKNSIATGTNEQFAELRVNLVSTSCKNQHYLF